MSAFSLITTHFHLNSHSLLYWKNRLFEYAVQMASEKTVSWTIEYPQVFNTKKKSPFKSVFGKTVKFFFFLFYFTHCSVADKLCLLFSSCPAIFIRTEPEHKEAFCKSQNGNICWRHIILLTFFQHSSVTAKQCCIMKPLFCAVLQCATVVFRRNTNYSERSLIFSSPSPINILKKKIS